MILFLFWDLSVNKQFCFHCLDLQSQTKTTYCIYTFSFCFYLCTYVRLFVVLLSFFFILSLFCEFFPCNKILLLKKFRKCDIIIRNYSIAAKAWVPSEMFVSWDKPKIFSTQGKKIHIGKKPPNYFFQVGVRAPTLAPSAGVHEQK